MVADQQGYLIRVDAGQTAGRGQCVVSADDGGAAKQVGRLSVDQRRDHRELVYAGSLLVDQHALRTRRNIVTIRFETNNNITTD